MKLRAFSLLPIRKSPPQLRRNTTPTFGPRGSNGCKSWGKAPSFYWSVSTGRDRPFAGAAMSTTRAMNWSADDAGRRIATKAATLAVALIAICSATPLTAQDADYVIYSSYLKKGTMRIGYCAIARADAPVQGKIMDRQKTRPLVCEQLEKRLKMGVVYPDSPGS